MSPVFILSRLCLKRRFQFFGISVEPPVIALSTTPTSFSPITLRRPTWSAFSLGTCTVMSLCRILIVRYSRFAPRTSRDSFLTIVPAPWCGYTTLSPTLYKRSSPSVDAFRQKSRRDGRRPRIDNSSKNRLEMPLFRRLQLQIAVHEVVLLEPAQALADLPCAHGADAGDTLEIALRGPDDRVEGAEVSDDPPDHRLGQAWNM